MAKGDKILLGTGIFSIGGVPVGLTKGGGRFTSEREYRHIDADGDRGFVKGRQEIDKEVPKLLVNGLDVFNAADMLKYYPALKNTAGTGVATVTGTLKVVADDYVDVQWVGKTKDGKGLTIKISDALNLTNIEWGLEDKTETIASLEYTGHYLEESRDVPPYALIWEVTA